MTASPLRVLAVFALPCLVLLGLPTVAVCGEPSKAAQELLKKDPMDILTACLARSQKLDQFTQTFTKRERVGGELQKTETMFLKYRAEPFSLYMKWTEEPNKGREVIYVEGKNKGKAVLHEYVGPLNVFIKLDPDSAEAKKRSRRTIKQAGIRNATKSLFDMSEKARKRGDMRIKVMGVEKVNDREVVVLCRLLERRDDYDVYMTMIYIDTEYMLPVKVAGYDWDQLLGWVYISGNIKTDVKLSDKDFDPTNPEYDYPGLVGLAWPFGKK
ncbi:MAG: DUF1571 domain-containing protein [Planctomycetota bacterium]